MYMLYSKILKCFKYLYIQQNEKSYIQIQLTLNKYICIVLRMHIVSPSERLCVYTHENDLAFGVEKNGVAVACRCLLERPIH